MINYFLMKISENIHEVNVNRDRLVNKNIYLTY